MLSKKHKVKSTHRFVRIVAKSIFRISNSAFGATLFCFFCIYLVATILSFVLHPLEKFNPLSKWNDVELSDLYFAYFSTKADLDNNIVIVDCSNESRLGIAREIDTIMQQKVKVIGIDVQFDYEGDTTGTSYLQNVLRKYSNKIVLAADHNDNGRELINESFYNKLIMEDGQSPNLGYLSKTDSCKVLRTFTPFIYYQDSIDNIVKIDTNFDVKILAFSNHFKALHNLNARNKMTEVVNYKKLIGYNGEIVLRYPVINKDMIPQTNLDNKIVLIGDCNPETNYDYHYSPMNNQIQRSFPDLKGVHYHAQVLSMLINDEYINTLMAPFIWIFLSCWFAVYFFLKFLHRPLFHLYLDIIILLLSPLLMTISICLLYFFNFKIEPGEFIVPIFLCGIILHIYSFLGAMPFIKKLLIKYQIHG